MNSALRPMEASWLWMESADAAMHTGALMVFDIPAGESAAYPVQLFQRLRDMPVADEPWQLCLVRGRAGWPRWQADKHFDIDNHFYHVRLPAPGGERELGVTVERLHSAPLALRRPLWECHLLSGLHGNRFALYFKVHPALSDATAIAKMLVDCLASKAHDEPLPPWAHPVASWRRESERELVARSGRSLWSQWRPLLPAFGRLLRAGGRKSPDLRAPYTAPYFALNVRTGPQRRVATQQYERTRLLRVSKAFDASEGELMLYLCATALRRFFKEHNALPENESLVAALPGQIDTASMGLVSLGTDIADPHQRLMTIQASLRASREHLRTLPAELMPAYTLLATSMYLLGQVTRLGVGAFPMFNLLISSTYGPDSTRWLGKSRLAAVYPMFPLLRSSALTIDCMRYDGKLHVAVVGASEEIPRLQRLAVYMGQALTDVEEMLGLASDPAREGDAS